MAPLLRTINLSSIQPGLSPVHDLSLEIYPGEVLGLAGQSGAGKSTLAMLLAGVNPPDTGDVYFDGRRLNWPFRARALGIEVIYQQPEIAEALSISRNVFLGNEIGWSVFGRWLTVPDHRRMDAEAARILSHLGMRFNSVHTPASSLSVEQRQLIAIGRVMTRAARLVIIDDPSLLLSYVYQQKLLALIREWQQGGMAVLFASDNVDQLMAVSDRILVLRHGRCVADHSADAVSREAILAAMVGAADQQQLTPIIWALDSYYRAREQAERLYQRQSLHQLGSGTHDGLGQQLIDQMADQIDALDRGNAALQDAQRRLLTELEQERKQLAREIHDQVIQDLLGVGYQLEEIAVDTGAEQPVGEELNAVRSSVRDVIRELREICGSLRPPTIDSLGLGSALQSYTYDWSKRTGILVTLQLDPELGRLAEYTELSIFRIVQEALTNIRKHSGARTTLICLEHTSPRRLMLSIADDGRGLPADFDLSRLQADGHYGVLGITERVALLGGQWRFQNRPEGGALIQVEVPHPRVEPSGM